jgi:hypothetical protein
MRALFANRTAANSLFSAAMVCNSCDANVRPIFH